VVQVKKKFVRQAILDSAYDLLSERGYNRTTLQDIADFAGTGVSSVYSYFPSKLHLLYAVVEPWYKEAFSRLERRVRTARTPRAKLRAILLGIWRDIPTENIQLANSLMEALATADPAQPKPVPLLKWTEEKLASMVAEVLSSGGGRFDHEAISTVLIMAYDGFVINRRLNDLRDIERLSDAICDILLGARASSER
jgi:AcrR family transcriptional regulator